MEKCRNRDSYWLIHPKSHICISGREKDKNPGVLGPSLVGRSELLWNECIMSKSQSYYILISWLRQLGWVNLTFWSQDFLIFKMGILLITENFCEISTAWQTLQAVYPMSITSPSSKDPDFVWGSNGPLEACPSPWWKWPNFCQWLISWGFLGKLLPYGIRLCPFLLPTCSCRQCKCRAGSEQPCPSQGNLCTQADSNMLKMAKRNEKSPGMALSLNSLTSHGLPASRLPMGEKKNPHLAKL